MRGTKAHVHAVFVRMFVCIFELEMFKRFLFSYPACLLAFLKHVPLSVLSFLKL